MNIKKIIPNTKNIIEIYLFLSVNIKDKPTPIKTISNKINNCTSIDELKNGNGVMTFNYVKSI